MDGLRLTAPSPRTGSSLGLWLEDLQVGMRASCDRTLTDSDVICFADLSGDCNPLHLDEDYARTTPFGGRIVHGMLSASLVSAVIAMQLPGPGSIYISQSLTFRAPVRIGDTVEAEVTVVDVRSAARRVALRTVCRVGDRVVVDGEAVVQVRSRGA